MCCASTARQHTPARRRVLDKSSSAVQVVGDIDETFQRFHSLNGHSIERGVLISDPRSGGDAIPTRNGIKGSVDPDKE